MRISAIGLYQVLRRRRAGGRQDPAVPADAAGRRQDRRAGADAARARAAGSCCRAKPTTSCRSSISGTSSAPTSPSTLLESLHERYPGNPLFLVAARRRPGSLSARHHRQPRDVARAAGRGARAARQRGGARRGAGPARHRPPARGALPDRSRDRAAARGPRREAGEAGRARGGRVPGARRRRGSARPSRRRGRRLSRRDRPPARRRIRRRFASAPPSGCAARRTPTRAEAYRLSLEGLRKLEKADLAGAESLLARSVALDPTDRRRALSLRPRAAGAKEDAAGARAVRGGDPRRARAARRRSPRPRTSKRRACTSGSRIATQAIDYYRAASTLVRRRRRHARRGESRAARDSKSPRQSIASRRARRRVRHASRLQFLELDPKLSCSDAVF